MKAKQIVEELGKIAAQNGGVDMGVATDMMSTNIKLGKNQYKGSSIDFEAGSPIAIDELNAAYAKVSGENGEKYAEAAANGKLDEFFGEE